jgi:hypothetical protein
MYYEIIIALNGKHLFATHKRSIPDSETFLKVFAILNEKFPEKEGYSLLAEFNPEQSRGTTRTTILEKINAGNPYKVFELFEKR